MSYIRKDFSQTAPISSAILASWMNKAKDDKKIVFVSADSISSTFAQSTVRTTAPSRIEGLLPPPEAATAGERGRGGAPPMARIDPAIRSMLLQEKRFVELGIQEANAALVSGGLAALGFNVYWQDMGWLFERGYNMVAVSICTDRYDVTMVATAGGIGGGTTHQNMRDIATMCAIPNLIVTAPADAVEGVKIAEFAQKYVGPVYIRAGAMANIIFEDSYQFKLGEAPIVREGDDATIIGMQEWVYKGIQAAEELAKEGIQARVIDMSSIKPIGEEAILKAAKETGAIVTAESTNIYGGLGSAVAGVVSESYPVPMKRLALQDLWTQSARAPNLMEAYYGQSVGDLVSAVKETIKRK